MKIKGFENYEIFEDGRIVNKHGRELKYFIQSSGYNQICLWKDCKRKHFLLHRLLALHFIVNTRPGIARRCPRPCASRGPSAAVAESPRRRPSCG